MHTTVRLRFRFAQATPDTARDVDTLNKAIGEALKDPKLVARLAEMGGIPKPMTPAEFGKLVSDETDKWRKVVEFAGASVD